MVLEVITASSSCDFEYMLQMGSVRAVDLCLARNPHDDMRVRSESG